MLLVAVCDSFNCDSDAAEELSALPGAGVEFNDESWRLKLIGNNLITRLRQKQR